MNMKQLFVSTVMVLTLFTASARQRAPFKLWYDKPSGKTWENALPVGNGRLAAMVYGNVEQDILQLNESTVWTGSPNRNDNPDALASLPAIRKLIFEGKQKEAQDLARKTIESKKSHGQMSQPVGNLLLNFPGHSNYTNYRRELNIEDAIASTTYEVNGIKYTRTVFASLPDQAIIVRLTAAEVGKLSFIAALSTPQKKAVVKVNQHELVINGITAGHETVEGKVQFNGIARVVTDGIITQAADSAIAISNAGTATIYISIATNFVNYNDLSADAVKRSQNYLTAALKKNYPQLLKEHITA